MHKAIFVEAWGLKTLTSLRALDPFPKAIVSSGYSNNPVPHDCENFDIMVSLIKPHEFEALGE